ncbi:MAG: CRISPR-associated endonuclease Cas2 [Crocosphaera sp.]
MVFYLVTYDITCDRRRKKVSDLLEGYGQRVQYSVFECVLTKKQYKELCSRIKERVDLEEDSIRFYPISDHTLGQVEVWGGKEITKPPTSTIV